MKEPDSSSRRALVDMAMGFFRGKVLCAAVRLGIADGLAGGAMTVGELAIATNADPDALRRFLRALASIGIVAEVAPSRFALTPLGEPLRRDAPDSIWASTIFWADLLADAWTYLPECVRAGDKSGATAAREREGVSSRWSREPDAQAIFHAVFAEPTAADFAPYVAAWDFSRFRVVADLGGGGGALLAEILRANPEARGVLVEREGAIDRAAKRFADPALDGRCELVAGDLTESVPAGADVYVIRCVLHGYDDESALRILRNCRRAMGAEDRLLVIEAVLPNQVDHADPEFEKVTMSDLNMLAVTGGHERSRDEWESLLDSARLQLRRVVAVPSEPHSLLEAICRE